MGSAIGRRKGGTGSTVRSSMELGVAGSIGVRVPVRDAVTLTNVSIAIWIGMLPSD